METRICMRTVRLAVLVWILSSNKIASENFTTAKDSLNRALPQIAARTALTPLQPGVVAVARLCHLEEGRALPSSSRGPCPRE